MISNITSSHDTLAQLMSKTRNSETDTYKFIILIFFYIKI